MHNVVLLSTHGVGIEVVNIAFCGFITIDLRENTLTLHGEVETEGGDDAPLLVEYETGKYYRQFTLSSVIDQNRIDAKLNDGVLRLSLPKVEEATPRQIQVKTG